MSEDERENLQPVQKKKKKGRGPNIKYRTIETFPTYAEAEKFLADEQLWEYKSVTINRKTGARKLYNCKHDDNCSAKRCIFVPVGIDSDTDTNSDTGTEAFVYVQAGPGEHDHEPPRDDYGIDKGVKKVILELFTSKKARTTETILNELRNRKDVPTELIPTAKQVENHLNTVRKNVHGDRITSLNKLEKVVNSYPEFDETDLDAPFLLAQDFDHSPDPESEWFCLVWTTKRLLALTELSRSVNIDATYKLNSQGYPVLVVGTTDRAKHFHPFAVALARNETGRSFAFLFKALREACQNWKPDVLIADSAVAITNGFEVSFALFCLFAKTNSVLPLPIGSFPGHRVHSGVMLVSLPRQH